MERYGKVLLIAMPIFIVLILAEAGVGLIRKDKINVMDTISSLFSGMTNTLKDVLGLTIVVVSYPWLLQKLSLIHWGSHSVMLYVVTFVLLDFCGYWYHRICHSVNYFWNIHLIHHSSEEFNLPCALRQQFALVTNMLQILVYGILMAMFGIPHVVMLTVAPIHLFLQFWYHTRYIDKLGFIEHVLVTPSHHRVHHAMNDVYMDKNFAQIFIVWDKLFGTFQQELDSEKPIYGIRRPAQTWNPFIINLQHVGLLLHDAIRTKSWKERILLWFKPTGYRPSDVSEKHPVFYIKKMEDLEKYNPVYSTAFKIWTVFQNVCIYIFMSHLFLQLGTLSSNEIYTYGLFILFAIFSFTSYMDKKSYGLMLEYIKTIIAFSILYIQKDWFCIGHISSVGVWLMSAYFVASVFVNSWFYWFEFEQKEVQESV